MEYALPFLCQLYSNLHSSLLPSTLFSSAVSSQLFLPLSVPHISFYHRPAGSQSCVEHHWGLQTDHFLRHSNYLALLLLNALLTVGLRGVKYLFFATKFLGGDSTAAKLLRTTVSKITLGAGKKDTGIQRMSNSKLAKSFKLFLIHSYNMQWH